MKFLLFFFSLVFASSVEDLSQTSATTADPREASYQQEYPSNYHQKFQTNYAKLTEFDSEFQQDDLDEMDYADSEQDYAVDLDDAVLCWMLVQYDA